MSVRDDLGNPWERELNYYRRECNELGARLLRRQEDQSRVVREGRRSRIVAKLVREVFRLSDLGGTEADLTRSTLEIVVENVMCDRAMLLREAEVRSGAVRVHRASAQAQQELANSFPVTAASGRAVPLPFPICPRSEPAAPHLGDSSVKGHAVVPSGFSQTDAARVLQNYLHDPTISTAERTVRLKQVQAAAKQEDLGDISVGSWINDPSTTDQQARVAKRLNFLP